jgi:hypothetical protein
MSRFHREYISMDEDVFEEGIPMSDEETKELLRKWDRLRVEKPEDEQEERSI